MVRHGTSRYGLNQDQVRVELGSSILTAEGEECRTRLHLRVCAFFDLGGALRAPEVATSDYRGGLRSGKVIS